MMNLPPELFQQVTVCLASSAPDAPECEPEREQRQRPRVGVKGRVTVIPFNDSLGLLPFTVAVRDLGPGGLGFLYGKKIALDEQFVVLLPVAGDGPLAVLCTVAYWQPLAENLYAIGAKFTRVLRQGAGVEPTHDRPAVAPAQVFAPGDALRGRRAAS